MALSRNKIKYVQSLKEKKQRLAHGTFVAEGKKIVSDLLVTCRCQYLIGLPDIVRQMSGHHAGETLTATPEEMKRATHLKSAPQLIGVFYQPRHGPEQIDLSGKLNLVLDGIQDPGNMGTIVRLADWFGIEQLICSPDTADIYHPKTVQATMGAIARVKVYYVELADWLGKNANPPLFGTFLEGENIYRADLPARGWLVMGSEGRGISETVSPLITRKLFIPNYPPGAPTSESLNVAAATAIVCSEFRRRMERE